MDKIRHLWILMDKNFLSVKELANKLNVSEKTVYRMLNKGESPFVVKIGGQWRFNAEKISKWIKDSDNYETKIKTDISIHNAMENGNIFYRLIGENRDELFECLFDLLPDDENQHKNEIKNKFFYYESFMTNSRKGVLLINPNADDVYPINKSKIYLGFFDKPLCLKSIDGIETFLFVITFARNKVENYILNTKLGRLLMEKDFIKFLKTHPNRKEILSETKRFEDKTFIGVSEC